MARVRIPPTIVFDLLPALNQELGQYEENFSPALKRRLKILCG